MIDLLRYDEQARVADLSFRQGCVTCGGDVVVRTSPYDAWSHCRNCRRLSRSKVSWTPSGIRLVHPTAVA